MHLGIWIRSVNWFTVCQPVICVYITAITCKLKDRPTKYILYPLHYDYWCLSYFCSNRLYKTSKKTFFNKTLSKQPVCEFFISQTVIHHQILSVFSCGKIQRTPSDLCYINFGSLYDFLLPEIFYPYIVSSVKLSTIIVIVSVWESFERTTSADFLSLTRFLLIFLEWSSLNSSKWIAISM